MDEFSKKKKMKDNLGTKESRVNRVECEEERATNGMRNDFLMTQSLFFIY